MHGGTTTEIPSPAMWVGLSLKPRAAEPSALNSSLDDIWDISSQVTVSRLCWNLGLVYSESGTKTNVSALTS